MSLNKKLAEQIAGADVSGGGNIIRDGKYLFCVQKVFIGKMYNGNMFVAEFGVVESEAVENDVEPNAVGTTCSYVINVDTNKSALGNIKAFLSALIGENPSAEDVEAITDKDGTNPARGAYIRDETYRKTIKSGPNAGKPFTAHRWEYVEQTDEEIEARAKKLDEGGE
jgi:hypothetical protein